MFAQEMSLRYAFLVLAVWSKSMNASPNLFATLALAAWPIVTIYLYLSRPIVEATLWTFLGAELVLPFGANIKLEGIPQFDKFSIPTLAALCGCFLVGRPLRIWTSLGLANILVVMALASPFLTAELNHDPIQLAGRVLPAEGNYDAISAVVAELISLVPFFIGVQLFRSPQHLQQILRVLVVAGLCYSLPMLFEIRMSPQLNYWIYGYYSSAFNQALRDGGFRPMVFTGHPLLASLFMMMATVAAAALWRTNTRIRWVSAAGATGYLGLVLLLCKSLSDVLYGAIAAPLVRFAKPRTQLRIALLLGALAFFYPILRLTNLVPTEAMLQAASMISQERAESLQVRLTNEDQLLQRATQRFIFGWGRWGRSRIYSEWSGRDISITDGRWIITIGQFGLFGFLAEFGLLILPIVRAASALKFARSSEERLYLAAVGLIIAINVFDLLPNSALLPWTWLLSGALLGSAEALRSREREPTSIASASNAIKVKVPI